MKNGYTVCRTRNKGAKYMADQHVGLTDPEAYEQTTTGESVTGKHLFVDGSDGKEKEVTITSAHAGASSEASAASGIPSAVKQHDIKGDTSSEKDETPMGGRVQPTTQNLDP